MIVFQIFKIRQIARDAHANPSKFAGNETKKLMWSIVMIPLLIATATVILFFLLGYTHVLGFQFWFFKLLFWISFFVSITVCIILRRIISSIGNITRIQTETVIKEIQ